MIAYLADDVDREKQLFAARRVVDRGGAPGNDVARLECRERVRERLVVQEFLCANAACRHLVEARLISHHSLRLVGLLRLGGATSSLSRVDADAHGGWSPIRISQS